MAKMDAGNRLYVPCTIRFSTTATTIPMAAGVAAESPAAPALQLAAQPKPVTKCNKPTFALGTHPFPTLTLQASPAGDLIKGGV